MNNEIELDDLAGWIDKLRELKSQRTDIDEQIERAENKIKDALGEAETGLVDGEVAVKYTHITSQRFDVKTAKTILTDEQIATCTKESAYRRFTLVEA